MHTKNVNSIFNILSGSPNADFQEVRFKLGILAKKCLFY